MQKSQIQNAPYARGFSLVELLVTVTVAAVLMAVAVPSFRDLSIRNRLSTYINDMIASVNFARSEAIRRGQTISICHSNDGASCSGNWSQGWIIFADANANNAVDAGETVLKAYPALSNNYAMGSDAALANNINYGPDGAATSVGLLSVCHDDEVAGAKALILTRLRPRVATDTDGDRIPNRDDGNNISSCATPGGP